MKNLFILLILSFIGCKAQQQILPLETRGIPIEGAYYKDLNNELDPYLGTWKGTFGNKKLLRLKLSLRLSLKAMSTAE